MQNKGEKTAPVLRFKGFSDDWEQRKLGDIVERVTRRNKELKTTLPLTISAQEGLIDQNDFFDRTIASRDVSNYYLVMNGDFAYNKSYSNGYPWGAVKRLERYDMGVLSTLYIVFKPTDVNSDFLAKYYDTNRWYQEVSKHAAEGARNHGLLNISASDFFETELIIPSDKVEQTKIASLIIRFDNLITLHQRKLDLLKCMKQGFLQQIFPEQGVKIPRLRFADFNEAWEQRKLFDNINKVIDFRGRTPKKIGLDWSAEGYLALSALNVKNGYIDTTVDAHFGNQELYDKWMEGNALQKGQVLFTTEAPMGNVAQVPDDEGYILSQRTISFDLKPEMMIDGFLAILLRSPNVYKELVSFSSGGTAKGVSQKSLMELSAIVPKNIEEQKATYLLISQINNLVTFHHHKVEFLSSLKKLFLQEIFI